MRTVNKQMKAQSDGTPVWVAGLGVIALVVAIIALFTSFYTIDQTQVGVVIRFGEFQRIVKAGAHWKAPLIDSVIRYPAIQNHYEYTEAAEGDLTILTADGLSADAEASLYFTVKDPKLVFETVGRDYENWLDGKARGVFREATADYTSDALYTGAKKDLLQSTVVTKLQQVVGEGFLIQDFQVRKVVLPDSTRAAIETKMAAQQTIQTKEYELTATRVEAEKVMAAANGTAQAQIIKADGEATSIRKVREALTPDYLKYLSITEVARSNNSKLVFLPANSSVLVGFGSLN